MCWFVPLIIAGVSAVASMQVADQEAEAADQAATYNANEAKREAGIAGMKAQNAYERGEADRETHMRQFQQEQGTRAANQGASGVVMGTGTGADVLADSAALAELDGETIRYNAAVEQWGYKEQQRSALAQADLSEAEGQSALNAAKTKKTSILLSSAGSMAGGFGGASASGSGMNAKSSLLTKEKIKASSGSLGLKGGSR